MGSDLSKHLEKAEKYLQKGKTENALEEYLAALELEPNNDSVRQNAADLAVTLNRNGEAAQLLSDLFNRQAGGDPVKAQANYKKLLRVGTPTIEQTYRYAQLVEKSNKKEALENYQATIKAFLGGNRRAEAKAALQRVVQLEPTPENYLRLGELAEQLGDSAVAADAFLKFGQAAEAGGDQPLEWYERAYTQDASNADVALHLGRTLTAGGNSDRAITVLHPFATAAEVRHDIAEAYGRALIASRQAAEAEPFIWALFERDPRQIDEVAAVIGLLLELEQTPRALQLIRKLEQHQLRAGLRREFVALIKQIADAHEPRIVLLEYLVELYNQSNREADYCAALVQLYELYFAAGRFINAADALDRAAEVDPYEQGHAKRLEALRGKIEGPRFTAISNRLAIAGTTVEAEEKPEEKGEGEGEPTVLEDFILQAEIFLQYSMRSKALERIERIHKLFPREEEKNEKLRMLYANAGFVPQYADGPGPGAPVVASAPGPAASAAAAQASTPAPVSDNENAIDNFSRVTEITRNIYRQGSVKSVLFVAVNDVGRHYKVSRCLAALCTPGKPPSATHEYCAPGVAESNIMHVVKLIGALQALAANGEAVVLPSAATAPELASIQAEIAALAIQSLMAVPLMDAEEQTGILILQQCDYPRFWRGPETVVARTIAEQMALAVNNARLRSLMKTLSVTDEKSGLLKRASYIDVLLSEARRCQQQNSTATIMLMHFGRASALVKEIGEAAVDTMMQQLGQALCTHLRQNDVAVRYELSTIALVLADTNEKNAFFVVDKMRKVLSSTRIPGTDRQPPITVGIAEIQANPKYDPIDIVTEAINRVEAALEAAKAEGGNKAVSRAPQVEAGAVA